MTSTKKLSTFSPTFYNIFPISESIVAEQSTSLSLRGF